MTSSKSDTKEHSALVLFSGGQDSATALAWALEKFAYVETVGFNYGQNHSIELQCRQNLRKKIISDFPQWIGRLGEDHMLPLPTFHQLSDSSLTRKEFISKTSDTKDLPDSFVPGRNIVFMIYSFILAYRRKLKHIVTGVCETDYSGYPDCRDDSMKALQVALNLGMDENFVIHTPLMWLTKAQTWELAYQLGHDKLVDLINHESHSCYKGERGHYFEWGYGCGECPACQLRKKGWDIWKKDFHHE